MRNSICLTSYFSAQLQANGIAPLDTGRKPIATSQDVEVLDLTLDDEDAAEVEAKRIQALEVNTLCHVSQET